MTTTDTTLITLPEIKVVINNRNRLTTTRKMVEQLFSLNPKEQIIIIDNGSTYPPLMDWYDYVGKKIDIRYHKNEGHLALWATGIFKELGDHYVYTDSDIQLNTHFPSDWKKRLFEKHIKYGIKAALAIRIDDLPEHYRYKNQVIRNEGKWWLNEIESKIFKADTDTTFYLDKNDGHNHYESVRLALPDMTCRHVPWYINLEKLDEEEKYYLDNVGERVTTQYTKQHINPQLYGDI